ncbi:MAG: hypothetical protein HC945_00620 [Nitrosarchaeum sp.]|nr:hypothetical protein [Nitrosarchaeum sp.]
MRYVSVLLVVLVLIPFVAADADQDGVPDELDRCPGSAGSFCQGCPEPACAAPCQAAVCTAQGPACEVVPGRVSCGMQECASQSDTCRTYEDVPAYCSEGVCALAACTAFSKAGQGTPCVTRGGFDGACDENGVCVSPEEPYLLVWDADRDGVVDEKDTCPSRPNPLQRDEDRDGAGDLCDEDRDGDGVVNANDVCPGTASGVVADPSGCSCAQKRCSAQGACMDSVCDARTAQCVQSFVAGRSCLAGSVQGVCSRLGVCEPVEEVSPGSRCPGCECVPGEIRSCGSDQGACAKGTQAVCGWGVGCMLGGERRKMSAAGMVLMMIVMPWSMSSARPTWRVRAGRSA